MEYSKVKTFHFGGHTVRVHFPDLPEEEKVKRKSLLEKAAERFLKHAERVQDSATQDIPEVKEG